MSDPTPPHSLTYILPIKNDSAAVDEEFTAYLGWLDQRVELVVVDASAPDAFDAHAKAWQVKRHLPPQPALRTLNGKVWGVMTGLAHASHDNVVIADDDVRYDDGALTRVATLLDEAEIVRPQNYFSPAPWHARWDTARSLLNRMTGGDWPGTLAVHRSSLPEGYDGNCLFENLEMVRTVCAGGGREHVALGLYVLRRPPTTRHFFSQRVRQAYDELARPPRFATQLALLPLLALLSTRLRLLPAFAVAVIAIAEIGRRRQGGQAYFPVTASLMAPLWLLERGACAWLALGLRLLRGGVTYHGTVIARPATPLTELRERLLRSGVQKEMPS